MQRYIVQPHDTVFSIAHKFGVTRMQVLAENPKNNKPEQIFAGQIINIPNYTYIVHPGDTLNKIAQHFMIPYSLLISSNPQILYRNYITVGQIMSVPSVPISIIAPTQLKEIELNAENILNAIVMQDWDIANSELSIMKDNFNELKPILQENLISPSLIYRLEISIINLADEMALKREYESRVQANLITLYTSYMLDYYKVEIPTDIDKLEFLGREIIINAEKNNWDSIDDNFDFLNVIWKDLQTMFPSESNQLIVEFTQIVDSLGQFIKSKNSVQTISKANEMLDKVDALEECFKTNL